MGFRTGSYATVWEVKNGNGNYSDVRISTSKKNKQSGEYETDFSGFVRFVGTAHQAAPALKAKDKIKIGDCEVTNSYSKEKGVTYTNYAVFTFELATGNNTSSSPTNNNSVGNTNIPDGTDEELPFN